MNDRRPLLALISLLVVAALFDIVIVHIIILVRLPQEIAQLASRGFSTATTTQSTPESTGCDAECKATLTSQIQTLSEQVSALETKKTAAPPKTTSSATTKEFFVPMGGGSSDKSDWTDIAGTDVFIDTANFPHIKTVYFETSMHIPTKNGVVTARLYNVTDKHPVWYSDISTEQDTSTFLSSVITLSPGNKQYRVQLKTSLQYMSLLDSARIKILLQ